MQIYDCSNPTNLVHLSGPFGFDDGLNSITDIEVRGSYAYVADDSSGLHVLDVSDGTHPVHIGGLLLDRNSIRFDLAGQYAYLADNINGLYIVDIRDPTNMFVVAGPLERTVTQDILVDKGRLFVLGVDTGLKVFDLQNSTNLVLLNTIPLVAGSIYAHQDTLYVPAIESGLLMFRHLPKVQVSLEVDAEAGVPFTILAAQDFGHPDWSPIFTTNSLSMPVRFTDRDVSAPHKLYQVRQ